MQPGESFQVDLAYNIAFLNQSNYAQVRYLFRILISYFSQFAPCANVDYLKTLKEADDPKVAILLLDFVLGQISSPNPAGGLIGAVRQAKDKVVRRGGCLTMAGPIESLVKDLLLGAKIQLAASNCHHLASDHLALPPAREPGARGGHRCHPRRFQG